MRNKIRDHFRSKQRVEEAAGGTNGLTLLCNLEAKPPSADSESGRSELAGLRQRALAQVRQSIASRIWNAFYRTAIEGDSPGDVAEDLDMSVWAVYKARSRVLKKLRDEFADLV